MYRSEGPREMIPMKPASVLTYENIRIPLWNVESNPLRFEQQSRFLTLLTRKYVPPRIPRTPHPLRPHLASFPPQWTSSRCVNFVQLRVVAQS